MVSPTSATFAVSTAATAMTATAPAAVATPVQALSLNQYNFNFRVARLLDFLGKPTGATSTVMNAIRYAIMYCEDGDITTQEKLKEIGRVFKNALNAANIEEFSVACQSDNPEIKEKAIAAATQVIETIEKELTDFQRHRSIAEQGLKDPAQAIKDLVTLQLNPNHCFCSLPNHLGIRNLVQIAFEFPGNQAMQDHMLTSGAFVPNYDAADIYVCYRPSLLVTTMSSSALKRAEKIENLRKLIQHGENPWQEILDDHRSAQTSDIDLKERSAWAMSTFVSEVGFEDERGRCCASVMDFAISAIPIIPMRCVPKEGANEADRKSQNHQVTVLDETLAQIGETLTDLGRNDELASAYVTRRKLNFISLLIFNGHRSSRIIPDPQLSTMSPYPRVFTQNEAGKSIIKTMNEAQALRKKIECDQDIFCRTVDGALSTPVSVDGNQVTPIAIRPLRELIISYVRDEAGACFAETFPRGIRPPRMLFMEPPSPIVDTTSTTSTVTTAVSATSS